jgi:sugar (pentulose or hexulose) kinase
MAAKPVIAIIDVGKTNKKLFLFDEHYHIDYEQSARFTETVDEDGDPCENLESLRLSVFDSLRSVFRKKEFHIKAINFSTYGASFVFINEEGHPVFPLYNYLKAYPQELLKNFYEKYGGAEAFSLRTASPVLGSLNSGMQVYRLKTERPEQFREVRYALHLPQYLSYLISGQAVSDITSIGCHTNLWDFEKNSYHEWVSREGIDQVLAPIARQEQMAAAVFPGTRYKVGIGLHDSSASLIPYLVNFQEPFVLISTGTWCISLNPFTNAPLTTEELQQDCLCYLEYQGRPVKASRLFAGQEHEDQVKRIAAHFNQNPVRYRTMDFNPDLLASLNNRFPAPVVTDNSQLLAESVFASRDLADFTKDEEAYHQLMVDIMFRQQVSTRLVLRQSQARRIFVDGGFSRNAIYMNLLAYAFPGMEVYAASMAQATALGAALAVHQQWNARPLPNDVIQLKYYAVTQSVMP